MSDSLKVRVVSPKETIFEAEALSVSSKNSTGKFDILPQHANFVTLIQNEPINIVKVDKTKVVLQFPQAICHVSADLVNIYTQIAGVTEED